MGTMLKYSLALQFLYFILGNSNEVDFVPDVLARKPLSTLTVTYNKLKVDNGNKLTPDEAKVEPTVIWEPQPRVYYTLSMVDPDAPSRSNPKYGEYLHWLVVNIPENDISKGQKLMEYAGPSPPQGSGLHRYIFLLFKQPEKLNFDAHGIKGRVKFSIQNFIEKYQMEDPSVAGNYFQAQY